MKNENSDRIVSRGITNFRVRLQNASFDFVSKQTRAQEWTKKRTINVRSKLPAPASTAINVKKNASRIEFEAVFRGTISRYL